MNPKNHTSGKRWLKFVKRAVPAIFYSLLLIFLGLYLQSIDYSKLEAVQFDWWYVAIATFFGLAFRYFGAYIWFVILKGLGARELTDKIGLVYVYAKTWLGRYIPGTAPWILGKIYFASQYGISKNKLAVSSLLEGGLQIGVMMVIALALLLLDPRTSVIDSRLQFLMLLVAIAGVIALTPSVFNAIFSVIYKLFRRQPLKAEHQVDGKTVVKGALLYAVGTAINGASFFFITKAVYPELSYADAMYVIGTLSLAGAASMLAIFAPSGLGVREGIQLILLSVIMPTEIALVVTVASRLWSIAVDLLFFGFSWILQQFNPAKTSR